MAQQLDQLLQEQQAMTGAMAHELRTPIANLRFALDLIRTTDDDERLREQIAEMDVDIDELDALVGELLTYARLRPSGATVSQQTLRLKPLLTQQLNKLGPLQPSLDTGSSVTTACSWRPASATCCGPSVTCCAMPGAMPASRC